MKREVFVSYSQTDRSRAFELVDYLESHGISAWIAPRDIQPAADWAEAIIEAISAASLMVLVFSAQCDTSPQVRREVERAVHRGIPVLTFRLENVIPTRSLEYFLSTQHWMDAFDAPIDACFERLVQHIAGLTSTSDASAAKVVGADLRLLRDSLVDSVGPIGTLLLQRAVRAGLSGQLLVDTLAGEIDAPAQRKAFLTRHGSA